MQNSTRPDPVRMVLVMDSERDAGSILAAFKPDFSIEAAKLDSIPGLWQHLRAHCCDIVVCSERVKPDRGWIEALTVIREEAPEAPLIVVSNEFNEQAAANAIRNGAHDFLEATDFSRLRLSVLRALEQIRHLKHMHDLGQKKYIAELFSSAPISDWELETGERIWNDTFYQVFGYRKEEVPPWNQWWFERVHPEDRVHLFKSLRSAIDQRQHFWGEFYRFQAKDGEYRQVLDRSYVVYSHDGQPLRIIGSTFDLTKGKKNAVTEIGLSGSGNGKVQKAERLSGAKFTHEMRMPLHNILTASELLGDELLGALNEKQGEYVRLINKNCKLLLGVVEDILNLLRSQDGDLSVKPRNTGIRDLLSEIRQMMTPLLEQKKQHCEIRIAPDVPEKMMLDPARVKQMLINLLSNAHKFSGQGQPIILQCKLDGQGNLLVSVLDQGPGIAAEELEKIQQPFEQRMLDTSGRLRGTGLGLHLVKTLAEKHHGSLEIESEPGRGSEFIIRLPIEFSPAAARHPESVS